MNLSEFKLLLPTKK